jgi:hypothetical protein
MAGGQPDPVTLITLGLIALLGVLGNDRRLVSEGIAEDPPRDDFTFATRPRPLGARFDLLGDSPVGRVGAKATRELWLGNLRLEALLRATERSMGADEAGKHELAARRYAEGRVWARRAGERYSEFGESLRGLSDLLRESDQEHRWRLPPQSGFPRQTTTFEELFDPYTLALLYRIGVPITAVRQEVTPTLLGSTPVLSFALLLPRMADENDVFANFLVSLGGEPAGLDTPSP